MAKLRAFGSSIVKSVRLVFKEEGKNQIRALFGITTFNMLGTLAKSTRGVELHLDDTENSDIIPTLKTPANRSHGPRSPHDSTLSGPGQKAIQTALCTIYLLHQQNPELDGYRSEVGGDRYQVLQSHAASQRWSDMEVSQGSSATLSSCCTLSHSISNNLLRRARRDYFDIIGGYQYIIEGDAKVSFRQMQGVM